MTLSAQQLQAISEGEAVELTIHGTHCVLMPRDLYLQTNPSDESSPRESYATVLKVLDGFDDTPEQYLEYLNE